jgi:hypothetical protein
MDAAFMSLEQREIGIHTVWLGTSGARVTEVPLSRRILPYRGEKQRQAMRLTAYPRPRLTAYPGAPR